MARTAGSSAANPRGAAARSAYLDTPDAMYAATNRALCPPVASARNDHALPVAAATRGRAAASAPT